MTASSPSPTTDYGQQRGFTLVELAVVLAIVGLLVGSLLYTFAAQVEQRNRNETEQRLAEARELLLGYAIVNGRLPCPARFNTNPAVVSDSSEKRVLATGQCSHGGVQDNYGGTYAIGGDVYVGGLLPAQTIGFRPVDSSGFAVDAWGNRIRYAVSATTWGTNGRFTTQHVAGSADAWTLSQAPGDLVICSDSPAVVTSASCDANESVTNVNTVVAVVFSTGRNGATGGTGVNEARNLDGAGSANALFVWRAPDPPGAAGGEYDDIVSWIPVGLLYGRMVAAGVLP